MHFSVWVASINTLLYVSPLIKKQQKTYVVINDATFLPDIGKPEVIPSLHSYRLHPKKFPILTPQSGVNHRLPSILGVERTP